jgi:hypothetical protein
METWAEVTAGTAEPSAGAATISTTPDVPGDVACSTTPIWAPVKLDSMTPISQEITRFQTMAPPRARDRLADQRI